MGRKNKDKQPKDWVKRKPDESLCFGPIRIDRYGRYIHFSNTMTFEEHKILLSKMKITHSDISMEISIKIEELQKAIAQYNPIDLLHRAAYEVLPLYIRYESESDYQPAEGSNLTTLEYLQYLISRSKFNPNGNTIDDSTWPPVWKMIKDVIKLAENWIWTRPPLTNPPTEIDELRTILDIHRLGIRIKRYQIFLKAFWEDCLIPFSSHIEKAYGITAENFISALNAIHNYQRTGMTGRYRELIDTDNRMKEALQKEGFSVDPNAPEEEVARTRKALESPSYATLLNDYKDKANKVFTTELFDITDIGHLPISLLDLLSVKEGESLLTSASKMEDTDNLSPLTCSPLSLKPFFKFNNRYYLFLHPGFEDNIGEIVERDLFDKYSQNIAPLTDARSNRLEERAAALFSMILNPDFIIKNAYYPNPDAPGSPTELDVLIGVDDILLLIESKSGRFRDNSSSQYPTMLINNLRDLVVVGQQQAERAERYCRSLSKAPFYDSKGIPIHELDSKKYREIFRVVVTREHLSWVGAKISRLSIIDKGFMGAMPWHISVDDLRAIADMFDNRGPQFVHFLEQRLMASSHTEIEQIDEMDHVGLYLKHNMYHLSPIKDVSNITYSGYSREIDVYFGRKHSGDNPDVPGQKMPPIIQSLIQSLSASGYPGRYELVSFLLSMDTTGRKHIEEYLAKLDEHFRNGKNLSVRFPMRLLKKGISLTLATDDLWRIELARSAASMNRADCSSWFAVQITGVVPVSVSRVEKIFPGSINQADINVAMEQMDREFAIKHNGRKIGRNEHCPCASGKKYKYCHGR